MVNNTKTSLLLMEIIIMLLLFVFCAAICLRLFAFAHIIAYSSRDLTNASLAATSVAECYKAAQGNLDITSREVGGLWQRDTVLIEYDDEWHYTNQTSLSAYTLTLCEISETGLESSGVALIKVSKRGVSEPLFAMEVKAIAYE